MSKRKSFELFSRAIIVICVSAFSALSSHQANSAERFLVKDGKAMAEIVISPEAKRTTKLAAEELRKYIVKITGAKLEVVSEADDKYPVKVYVGESNGTKKLKLNAKGLKNGAYKMASGDNWVAFIGADTEYVPPKGIAKSRGDRKRAAAQWYKDIGDQFGFPFMSTFKGYNTPLKIWSKDDTGSLNAVNDFLRSLGIRWFMPGDFGEVTPTLTSIALPSINKTVKPKFDLRHMGFYYNAFFQSSKQNVLWKLRLGLDSGGDIGGHGIINILQPAVVKRDHPEYFALYDGKRATISRGGKPCLSSPGLFKATLAFARLMFDKYDRKIISLMPTDAYSNLCECELCKGKGTSDRGYDGQLSDYVWGFINRVAKELYKSHPDKFVSCYAYSSYLQPPLKIDKLSPNVLVGMCQWRSHFSDPKIRAGFMKLRSNWEKKITSGKFYIWDYYLHARPNGSLYGIPAYYPHVIAEDIKSLNGKAAGDGIEVARNYRVTPPDAPDPTLAVNHLNCYITSRLYWDPDQSVDVLLDDYYKKFYGPAAKEMKTFVDFCEKNYPLMLQKVEPNDKALKLIATALKAAGTNSIYAKRVKLVSDYVQRLELIKKRLLNKKNTKLKVRLGARDIKDLKFDGKLNDNFWKQLPVSHLKDLQTGNRPAYGTTFKIAYANNKIYFGIRCEDRDTKNLNIKGVKDGDPGIWNGDVIELLIETPMHSYYQIAINPSGFVVDADRKAGINTLWSSGIKVASYVGKDFWSLEAAIPIVGAEQETLDATYGISGDKPNKTYPWFFNLCRQRVRKNGNETTAFSPTGKKHFHVIGKFGKITTRN